METTKIHELWRLWITQVLVATAANASVDNVNVLQKDVDGTVATALSRATAALVALGHELSDAARSTLEAFEVRKRV